MLCQFTVKNFKSIRDEMTFDMQAAAISEHEDRVIKDRDGELFLPVSAVYGPNGGGKSNVLEALHSLVFKVLRPLYATSDNENAAIRIKRILIEPFAFSAETVNAPTEFELFFRTALAEYRYELTVRKDVIEYERLDRVKLETGRRSALFERDENEITLKGVFSKLRISEDLSETLPLLSYLGITYAKNEVVQDVLSWFDDGIDFLNYGNPRQELRMAIANSDDVKDLVLKNRSYRGYDKTRKVTGQELQEFVDLARITASSANIQPLKYYVSSKEQEVEDILKLTKWAAALPDLSLPYPEMGPSGFIVICLDTAIGPNETTFLRDIGIAAQTMLLAAAEKELGGCMIGNFDKNGLKKLLQLPEGIEPNLVVAFGRPAEKIVLTDVGEDGNTRYYRDETGTVHFVPKRSLKDVLL